MAIRNVIPGGGKQTVAVPNSNPFKPAIRQPAQAPTLAKYLPAAAPAAQAPAPVAGGGSYGGGLGALGGGGGVGAVSGAATGQTDADYLAGDSQFQLQLAALQKALADEQTDTGAQQTKYNTDYSDALKNLGYLQDDPTTPNVNEGAWNFQDTNTSAGRSFQNQQNDFAGRGLLQSSLYGQANDNLTRSLNDQLSSTNSAKQSFMDDLARQQSTFQNDNQNQTQQARIDALARRAAGVSLVQ